MNVRRYQSIQIPLSEDELAAVDDWRFANRMPSRAATIRALLKLGLAMEGGRPVASGRKSSEFGVIEKTTSGDRTNEEPD